MKNIEVEIRSFITEEQYKNLIERFKKEAQFLGEDEQVTYYFDTPQDLRIQKNTNYSKTWLKKGNLHDDHREEIEVRCAKDDFEKLEQLYLALGYNVQIKWFRKRHSFKWGDVDPVRDSPPTGPSGAQSAGAISNGVDLAIDHTKGYGYIIELEKLVSEDEKDVALSFLKEKMQEIGIPLTPKEEFKKQYEYYKEHWRELV